MRKRITHLFSFFCFLLWAHCVFAQQVTISGKVTGDKDETLPGVSVVVKGTNIGTVTDPNGKYSIAVPSDAKTLTFSSIGMITEEIVIGGRSQIDVRLLPDITSLNEVVVIGYGAVKKTDVTTSISSIDQKELKTLPVAGVDQAIQGRLSGVTVTTNGGQPGGGVSVRVRGITSVNGNEPLYVIDGVPFQNPVSTQDQSFLGGGSGQTNQSVLASINPNDIESIDILKDASAQAIYGSRAANGVVLITTKKGKAGEGKITYDTYYGIQRIPKKLPVMNLREFAEYQNSLVGEINEVTGGNQEIIQEFANPSLLGKGTDWQDEIYQQGAIQSHQLSFSGGQNKTNYYVSGSYFNQIGTLIETKFNRYTLRANIDHEIKSWLKIGFSANLNRSNQKIGLSDGFDAVTSTVLYNSPASPVRDVYGSYVGQTRIGTSTFGNPFNPVAMAKFRDVRNIGTTAFGALYAEVKILEGLTLRNEINYNFNLSSDKAFQPKVSNDSLKIDIISPSKLREQRTNSLFWAVKNYLNYNKSFGKHTVYVTLGHEAQASQYDYINASRQNLTLNLPSLGAGQGGNDSNEQIGAGAGEWSMESYFARLNYSFDNRYSISATIRGDGSSTFGPNKRWGYFPGVSASWTISNEKFAQNLKTLNYLKLRLGAGAVGNQEVGRANSYTSNVNLITIGPFGPGSSPDNVANPNLSWESVVTYNAGIDATLFNNILDVSVDVYKKVTTDMLLSTQLGLYSGLGSDFGDIKTPIANDGQMTNKGIDISVTSNNIRKPGFTWKTTLVFSHYKNKLDFLNTPDAVIRGDFNEYDGSPKLVSLSRQGYPVGSFYGFVTDGLFTSMEQLNNGTNWGLDVKPDGQWLGDVRFKDLNNDKKIDDKDVTEIGNPNPKFTLGLTNTVSYKGFDLSIFVYSSYGAKIFNYSRRQTEGLRNQYNNQLTTVMDRYTSTNTDATMPRYNQWHENNVRISDRYVEDGSYLRIQNVTLGYNLPKILINKIKTNNIRIYVSAQNLKTFTKYSGYDPELGAINNRATFMNVDNGRYPVPRTYTVGANIEF
ncbi:SusC/RagA family TonB-linked outer membrane protein [Xanthocytophaga flava]|uniref:SusC/RagA family TonB-linked outer membrane protein n=1 Tax=Xanthocytophaga flava TaxID=3048013 RepID=UPI0028D10B03|nr:TonB-dependent receptor [Xanthocytophaga flavus]MDJ1473640.1 TonB-dependent receptor [Xanthocytophaga flavus]